MVFILLQNFYKIELWGGIKNKKDTNDTIQKLKNKNIINTHLFGKSEIKDFESIQNLKSKEIKDVINYNDWTADDLKKLNSALENAKIRETKGIEMANSESVSKDKKMIEAENNYKKILKNTKGYDMKKMITESNKIPIINNIIPNMKKEGPTHSSELFAF